MLNGRSLLVAAALCVVASTSAKAQGFQADKLTLHGYLSQAFAISQDHAQLGIPTDGTTEYRKLALQFRYQMSDADNLTLQFGHRRLGTDPAAAAQSDVTLDWGFFQHRFGGSFVKVGKVPMPRGIYNETRFVGTILPFFRAPFAFYTEGFESLEGVVVGNTSSFGAWGVESSVFGGGYSTALSAYPPAGPGVVAPSRADRITGGQLWLNTPVTGLRVGAGANRGRLLSPSLSGSDAFQPTSTVQYSVDGTFDRFTTRAEWEVFNVTGLRYTAWYGEAGVKVTNHIGINGQYTHSQINTPTPIGDFSYEYNAEYGVGVNYRFSSRLILKAEGHTDKGYRLDEYLNPPSPEAKSRYAILSLATSF